MIEKIITYSILGLTLSLTFAYLNKLSRKTPDSDDSGKFVLRMSKLYNIVGYAGIVLGVIMVAGPLLLVEEEMEGWNYLIFSFVFLMFSALGTFSILYYRNHMVTYDDQSVEARNAFGKTQRIEWQNMKKISFNTFTGFIRISDSQNKRIRLHYHLIGISDFVNTLETKTGLKSKTLNRHFPG